MSKLNFLRFLLAFAVVTGFYSCNKDHPVFIPDDKLLLSEYHRQTEYIDDGYNDVFNQTFSYGSRQGNLFFSTKPIQSINFVDKGGSYNYVYENNRPATLVDNDISGTDQGLWRFYYNQHNRIIKTGLAYKVAAEPTVFDFYDYDLRGNLEYSYRGATKDNPDHYMKYLYNNANKLTGTEFYTKIAAGKPSAKPSHITSSPLPGYELSVYSTITSDNMKNPFHEQGSILFFHSNYGKTPYENLNESFIALMENNPLKVVYYFLDEEIFGPGAVITHNYSYTYNNKKYPITNTHVINDPMYSLFGSINRTSQFAYINN